MSVYTPEQMEMFYRMRVKRNNAKRGKVKANSGRRYPLDRMKGKSVAFVLLDGERFTGVIEEITRYEVLVNCLGTKRLVFKHAIKYIESKEV